MTTTMKQIRKTTKKEPEILQQDLLNLMLKKAGLKYDDLITSSIKRWIGQNLDLLAENELEKFKQIIL
ncbi:hypothetical protein FACS189432_02490 [Bacteroidia bacterium]|nr:hypothetical protein FACS189426_00550 [Bacteroidia bacterium]GHT26979.1 hypothetical protein FACS189432_02490 [Bacteroidia bacterium]